jgi:hypothetical protein
MRCDCSECLVPTGTCDTHNKYNNCILCSSSSFSAKATAEMVAMAEIWLNIYYAQYKILIKTLI